VGQGTGPGADRNLPAEALVHSCRLSEIASSATRADVADREGVGRHEETVLIRTMVEGVLRSSKLSLYRTRPEKEWISKMGTSGEDLAVANSIDTGDVD
jgi:hypothetical protein